MTQPQSQPKEPSKLLSIILLTITTVNAFFLLKYLFVDYKSFFHSDSAVKILLTEEIFHTRKFFPPNWYYPNELWVTFGAPLSALFVYFFKTTFLSHSTTLTVNAIGIFSVTYLLTASLNASKTSKLTIFAFLSSGISSKIAEDIFGQGGYGHIFIINGLILISIIHFIKNKSKTIHLFTVFTIMVLMSWSSPGRSLVFFLSPIIVSITFQDIRNSTRKHTRLTLNHLKPTFYLILLSTAGFILGTCLHKTSLYYTQVIPGAELIWDKTDSYARNLVGVKEAYFHIFGFSPEENEKINSINGLINFSKLAFSMVFAIGSFQLLSKNSRETNTEQRIVLVFSIYLLSLVMFFLVFTKLHGDNFTDTARYYSSGFLIYVICKIIIITDNFKNRKTSIQKILIALLIGLSALGYLNYTRPSIISNKIERSGLLDFLKKNSLNYGFATFWNAGVNTVLSGGQTKIRQIEIINGLPMPMRWHSSSRWYSADSWQGNVFLLLTKDEEKKIDLALLEKTTGEKPNKLKYEDFSILTFRNNIAKNIPGWNSVIHEPITFSITPYSLTKVGIVKKSQNTFYIEETNDLGILHYGPYITLEAGDYLLETILKSPKTKTLIGKIEIRSDGGKRIISEKEIVLKTQNETLVVEFSLSGQTKNVEFFVTVKGGNCVKLEKFILKPKKQNNKPL